MTDRGRAIYELLRGWRHDNFAFGVVNEQALFNLVRLLEESEIIQGAGSFFPHGAGGAEAKATAEPSNPETCGRHRS
jgi:hypothetical protein